MLSLLSPQFFASGQCDFECPVRYHVFLLASLKLDTIERYSQFIDLKELRRSSFAHSESKNETLMQQRHDDNLRNTLHRYFATQLFVIGRKGTTKSITYCFSVVGLCKT